MNGPRGSGGTVDTQDLGSCASRHAGSSPASRTIPRHGSGANPQVAARIGRYSGRKPRPADRPATDVQENLRVPLFHHRRNPHRCAPTSLIPWLDPHAIIVGAGPWALLVVCLIVFAETGLLVGFILPGDTLLIITGLLTFTGTMTPEGTGIQIPIWWVCLAIAVAAFLGGEVGYLIGHNGRPAHLRAEGERAVLERERHPHQQVPREVGARSRSCWPASCRSCAPSRRSPPASAT